ncbi:hypothetical protein [Acidianus brierleyi]|uniref:SWIM-type domain-containing protein n=1 Tax=Acidianus brierleyi TaxID=41673 RepID=A0A2U9IIN0_9CREN|nr:hypothetical protein [Acidianus brierleyi]AWR95883.1 hypothetical protein DFR85_02100 [Acidianus brierleyi]
MNIEILSVKKDGNKTVVDGLVPAKCAIGSYKVRIILDNNKLVSSQCQCKEELCSHAIKLYLHYRAYNYMRNRS